MQSKMRMYWIHALTPLHVGSGRGLGYIDLPIMREKVTNWPFIPGSAIKGVLADVYGADDQGRKDNKRLKTAFGQSGPEHSNLGSLVFTDARLVCLPVRSLYGTFAWCTSPIALRRLLRDLQSAGLAGPLGAVPVPSDKVLVPDQQSKLVKENRVFLEDLDFPCEANSQVAAWTEQLAARLFSDAAWQRGFKERFLLVPDDVFGFLCETGTEVAARVRLDDEKKTVVEGALWYEESLPAETVLAGLVWCDRVFTEEKIEPHDLLNEFCSGEKKLQIGGKATVGRGLVRFLFSNGGAAK